MALAFAVVGWIAFLFLALLYRRGNQINSRENLALEAHCLAMLLSDDFLDLNRRSMEEALNGHPEWLKLPTKQIVYLSMQGILSTAKQGFVGEPPTVNTPALCLKKVEE